MSYDITNILTAASNACTTLGITINKNAILGTADLGSIEDYNREQGQSATGALLIIDDNYKVEEMRDSVEKYSLLIHMHTRNNESDNRTKAASNDYCKRKMDSFLNALIVRGTIDNMPFNRKLSVFNQGYIDGWTACTCEIELTVTNCP